MNINLFLVKNYLLVGKPSYIVQNFFSSVDFIENHIVTFIKRKLDGSDLTHFGRSEKKCYYR